MGRLILGGGGHAHLETLASVAEFRACGHEVVLVTPTAYHYYSGMSPGMLGGRYEPEDVRMDVAALAEEGGGRVVYGLVERIDGDKKSVRLADGRELGYDVLSLSLGSGVASPLAARGPDEGGDAVPVKPVINFELTRQRIESDAREGEKYRVVVAGGGPAALETAGNAWRLITRLKAVPEVTLAARHGFLSRSPWMARRSALASLGARAIGVVENDPVVAMEGGWARLASGLGIRYDLAFLATGTRPPEIMAASGLAVGPDKGLAVDGHLRSVSHPEIFGGGDCIHFTPRPLDKVGVYAVRQGPVLKENLLAALDGKPLRLFKPRRRPYLLIYNLGDGRGVACMGGVAWSGKWTMLLKERIDRGFVSRFQS